MIESENGLKPELIREKELRLFQKFQNDARVLNAEKGYIDAPWINQRIDGQLLQDAGDVLAASFMNKNIHVVAGIPTMGNFLATAIALRLGCDIAPSRKGPEIPGSWRKRFSTKTLVPSFTTGEPSLITFNGFDPANPTERNVLLVDDFIAKGDSAMAVINELQRQRGDDHLNIFVAAYAAKLFETGVDRIREQGIEPVFIYGIEGIDTNNEIKLSPPRFS